MQMNLFVCIRWPPRYIISSVICSFGGFLWGYELLHNLVEWRQQMTRKIQNGHWYHWLSRRNEKLCCGIWITVFHRPWTDCLCNLDPRSHILLFCWTSSRHTRPPEKYRYWRFNFCLGCGSRSGSSLNFHVRHR